MPFPAEQSIHQIDLISAAQGETFENFSQALDDAGHSETWEDYLYTECPLPGQPTRGGHSFIIARPLQGAANQLVWGFDPASDEWYEDVVVNGAQMLSRGQVITIQTPRLIQSACPTCGAALAAATPFCPQCAAALPPGLAALPPGLAGALSGVGRVIGVPPGGTTITVGPGGGMSIGQPHPQQNNIRMTGNPGNKPPVVIPPGLGKTVGNDDFAAFLDDAIKEGATE